MPLPDFSGLVSVSTQHCGASNVKSDGHLAHQCLISNVIVSCESALNIAIMRRVVQVAEQPG